MQKRKLWWLSGILLFIVGGGVAALGTVLKHEPGSYRPGRIADVEARRELGNICLSKFFQMMQDLKTRQEIWGCEVNESQLNCFFEENFTKEGDGENLAKHGVSGLSVNFEEDDRCRFAFRYGAGWFSTVLSYDLKIWLVPKERNVIAVQILRARAGGLPISSQSLLNQLSEYARQQNYKVTLYRHESCPVAIIELQPYQPHPEGILTNLGIKHGKLTIQGRTLEHALAPPTVKVSAPLPR
jgi:hypothetical protein